jgi:hypothetical protein
MIDPRIQHLAACIPTEPLESSLAMKLEQKDYMHSSTRSFVQHYWDKVRPILYQAPEKAPLLKKYFVVSLNVKNFTKAVACRMEKNMLMVFTRSSLYDLRLSMREHGKWLSGSEVDTYLNIDEVDLCIKPTNVMETRSQSTADEGQGEDIVILRAFVVDYEVVVAPQYRS